MAKRYEIVVEESAELDLLEIQLFIAQDAPDNAAQSVDRVWRRLRSLTTLPRGHSLAPESEHFDEPVRQMVIGNYRALFVVRGSVVHIIRVRHSARLPLRRVNDD